MPNIEVEVIKLKQRKLEGKDEAWVMSKKDMERLISKYGLTYQKFRAMGISRSIWDNSLEYHKLGVNDIEGIRKGNKNKNHGNSDHGFSSIINVETIRNWNETLIGNCIEKLEAIFPGTKQIYANYHHDPLTTTLHFLRIRKELQHIDLAIKKSHYRVRKWAKRKNLEYCNTVSGTLETLFADILEELGLDYRPQYTLGKKYPFDFYIPKLNLLIELDGGGHKKQNDKVKNQLAKDNNHILLRFNIKDTIALRNEKDRIKHKICQISGATKSL